MRSLMRETVRRPDKLRPGSRRGVAPIEFLLYIPIFVAFVAAMFWLARVQTAALQVGILAEIEAAEKAVLLVDPSQLHRSEGFVPPPAIDELQRLVQGFSEGLNATQGLVTGESTLDTGEGVSGVVPAVGTTQDQHVLLAHSWESEVFAFPQKKSEQAELTLPASIRGIAPGIGKLDAFRTLLSFSGKATGMAGSGAIDELRKSVEQQRDDLPGKLNELRREIAALESELKNMLNAAEPDWGEIRRLRDEIASKRRAERRLVEAIDGARQALEHFAAVRVGDRPTDSEDN